MMFGKTIIIKKLSFEAVGRGRVIQNNWKKYGKRKRQTKERHYMRQSQIDYMEKLKDPRWQKKRLEILQRDEFTCQICYDTKSTLHIHHRRYMSGREPWEYPNQILVTLCENCHKDEGELMSESLGVLTDVLKDYYFSGEVSELADALRFLKLSAEQPQIMSKVLAELFCDREIVKQLTEKYFETLRNKHKEDENPK